MIRGHCQPDTDPTTLHRFLEEVVIFQGFGRKTEQIITTLSDGYEMPTYTNQFWTEKKFQANPIHEVSYRACFKPELTDFIIRGLSRPGETVYDPFTGRGTTLMQAALLGRTPYGNDINPLSRAMIGPRLQPPSQEQLEERMRTIQQVIRQSPPAVIRTDLEVFYHPRTLKELCRLREYFLQRRAEGSFDSVDAWALLCALTRLWGHSGKAQVKERKADVGYFSFWSLPPNMAVSLKRQARLNRNHRTEPYYKDAAAIIVGRSRDLLRKFEPHRKTVEAASANALLLTGNANKTPQIPTGTVDLVLTSPPFLDVVDYAKENWLRCWFMGIDERTVEFTQLRQPERWRAAMTEVFRELRRVVKPGGYIAFEVGEVRNGRLKLEDLAIPAGREAGLHAHALLINSNYFTKASKLNKVENGKQGTNSNRIVLFEVNKNASPAGSRS